MSATTLAGVLVEQAEERGDEHFLSFEDRTLSYGELDRAVNRVANGLASRGVGPGTGVAIMMGNCARVALHLLRHPEAGGLRRAGQRGSQGRGPALRPRPLRRDRGGRRRRPRRHDRRGLRGLEAHRVASVVHHESGGDGRQPRPSRGGCPWPKWPRPTMPTRR